MIDPAAYPCYCGRFRAFRHPLFFLLFVFLMQVTLLSGQSVKAIGDPSLDKYTLYNTYGPMRSVPGAFTSGPISNRHGNTSTNLNLTKLSRGLYLLRYENNGQLYTERFIKE